MKTIVANNRLLFILFFLFTVAGVILLVVFPKGELELLINKQHGPYLDVFFFYITYFGDGVLLIPIILLVFLRRISYGIVALCSFLISTVIVQSMKRIIFEDYPRPSKFFEKHIDIHFIDGLDLHSFYSFPSGHSSGAFAVFFIIGMFSKNTWVTVGCFFAGVLVALSRVYLMQHFFIDVYAGALIGVVSSFLVYYIFYKKSNIFQSQKLSKPLLKAFDQKNETPLNGGN